MVGKPHGTLLERFQRHAIPEPMSGCWLWYGSYSGGEYPRPVLYEAGKSRAASRLAMRLFSGPFPDEAFICHHCDNHHCVNPDHLYVGDHASNMRDVKVRRRSYLAQNPDLARELGRQLGLAHGPTKQGERNAAHKVTAAQAADIRRRHAAGENARALAAEFGLHFTNIHRISRGDLWRTAYLTSPTSGEGK